MINKILAAMSRLNASTKFKIFSLVCACIHVFILVFAIYVEVTPLMIFNICSVFTYILCFLFIRRRPAVLFYIGFFEIVLHSFTCTILIGNPFGFSLYFIIMVPLSFHLLHTPDSSKYAAKATLLSFISFVFFMLCYMLSEYNEPVYQSQLLDSSMPYIYIINATLTVLILVVSSLMFVSENEYAYDQLSAKNKELDNLANTDPLTGLYNRRTITEEVIKLYKCNDIHKSLFSTILCDIDNFKLFNDTYGHECGDEVLKNIAGILKELTRGDDYLCRWGGEEFLIILNNIELSVAKDIAERFRKSIEESSFSYNGFSLKVTMTFGVAASNEADNYELLFNLADERMYKGKHRGKNTVCSK